MKTFLPQVDAIERKWFVVDAADQIVGRLAVNLANILRGRHKPIYTPHLDTGDFIIVINADKVKFTGAKEQDKIYQRYSRFPGGLKEETAAQVRAKHPERIIEDAVWGMIPHNRLGRQVFRKLKVYRGPAHEHQAQQPEPLTFK